MTAWTRLGLGLLAALALALPPRPLAQTALAAAWTPLAQAAPAQRTLLAAHLPALNRLLDLYNYPAFDASWEVEVLAAPALRQHVAWELTRPGARLVIVADPAGGDMRLLPLQQAGDPLPYPQENLHNLALFNAVLSTEPVPPSSDQAWAARAQLYLVFTGATPPLPAAVALPAPRPGLALLRLGAWQFTFDAHGLLVGFRRVAIAFAGGGK